jgi:hypothetical protein
MTFVYSCFITACNVNKQNGQSMVLVSGIGTVMVQLDMVQMDINFFHVAQTTK